MKAFTMSGNVTDCEGRVIFTAGQAVGAEEIERAHAQHGINRVPVTGGVITIDVRADGPHFTVRSYVNR